MPTSQKFSVNKLNQRGVVAQALILILLLLGAVVGVYLVQNRTNLFPKAGGSAPVGPQTSFELVGINDCPLGVMCIELFRSRPKVGEEFKVKLYARSDVEAANLFSAKLNFPNKSVEVVKLETENSFIKNWVENDYSNKDGTISLVGGVPNPGFQTQIGGESALMATIIFKAKAEGKGQVSFTDSSGIYSNLNNINILTKKEAYDFKIDAASKPTPTALPIPQSFEVGLEAGEQRDTSKVDLVRNSGAKWVRLNFIGDDWSKGSGETKIYDEIINEYIKSGIKIIGLIGAQSIKGGYNRNDQDGFTQKYLEATDAIVKRFGDRVKVYELFNEPNDWAGGSSSQISAEYFAKYLGRIYRQIKITEGRKDIAFISGPLFSFDLANGADYLSETYNRGKQLTDELANWEKIKKETGSYPLDGIGYHIYVAQGMDDRDKVENKIRGNLDAIEGVIKDLDPGKKIWISEFGWGTGKDRVTEEVQADNLKKSFNIFKNDPFVIMAMWFTLNDFDNSEWGLVRGDGVKKKSWGTFEGITGFTSPTPTPTPTPTPVSTPKSGAKGDGNKDGKVDLVDMSILHTDWNIDKDVAKKVRDGIDMNDDGLINTADFASLRQILQNLKVIKLK